MDRERARHWLAYGQKWNEEEAAERASARLSPTQGVST
jgi:hypothetical protein